MSSPQEIIQDRYRVLEVIGGGSFGIVYRAEDMQSPGTIVAVKEIIEGNLPDHDRGAILDLFTREASILKSLIHRGLPHVIDAFSAGDRHYIVMEFIEGNSLHQLMKSRGGGFPADEVIPWARSLAQILEYLHNQKPQPVIFRDLKPGNIMLDSRGNIKVIDFGIARHFNPDKTKDTYALGTPGFSAPEQYGRGQSDQRSDIYSLGATIYFLLTAQDLAQFHFKIPQALNTGAPAWLERIILKCLALNPGERYQSAGEVLHDLEQPMAGSAASAASGMAPTATPAAASKAMGIWSGYLLWLLIPIVLSWFHYLGSLAPYYRDLNPPALKITNSILFWFEIAAFFGVQFLKSVYSAHGAYDRERAAKSTAVMLVLLFLYTLIAPNFYGSRNCGYLTACKSNLKNIGTALEMYSTDNFGRYPPRLDYVTPNYVKVIPTCYYAGKMTYEYIYRTDPDCYTTYCKGPYHENITGQANYPQYDSINGLLEP